MFDLNFIKEMLREQRQSAVTISCDDQDFQQDAMPNVSEGDVHMVCACGEPVP